MGARIRWRTESESEGQTGMKNIIEQLASNDTISGYRVSTVTTETYEVFFVHRKLETVRATDTCDVNVTVYIEHDGKLGDSSFAVYDSMNDAEVSAKIQAAADRARLVFNEPYELPCGTPECYELESNMKDESPRELAVRIANAVFAAECENGSSINATEIFLYRTTTRVQNSRGVDKTQIKYSAMIEAIPTFTEGEDSVELYESLRFTEFDSNRITAEIAEKMREVTDRRRAVKPQTPITSNIVLRADEIANLAYNLAMDLNYSAVYSKGNLHSKGDNMQKGNGDKLNLSMIGRIPGSAGSAYFDGDGVTLRDVKLISDGIVSAYHGSQRFASYLGEIATGEHRCISLESGTLTCAELAAQKYIECASLSGLQVDLYNDYIGGEIRLAYLHDGDSTVPLSGISMSAKLSDVLANLRLSDTQTVSGNYSGPDKLLAHDITIM